MCTIQKQGSAVAAHKRDHPLESLYIRVNEYGGAKVDIINSLVRKTGDALSCKLDKHIRQVYDRHVWSAWSMLDLWYSNIVDCEYATGSGTDAIRNLKSMSGSGSIQFRQLQQGQLVEPCVWDWAKQFCHIQYLHPWICSCCRLDLDLRSHSIPKLNSETELELHLQYLQSIDFRIEFEVHLVLRCDFVL